MRSDTMWMIGWFYVHTQLFRRCPVLLLNMCLCSFLFTLLFQSYTIVNNCIMLISCKEFALKFYTLRTYGFVLKSPGLGLGLVLKSLWLILTFVFVLATYVAHASHRQSSPLSWLFKDCGYHLRLDVLLLLTSMTADVSPSSILPSFVLYPFHDHILKTKQDRLIATRTQLGGWHRWLEHHLGL